MDENKNPTQEAQAEKEAGTPRTYTDSDFQAEIDRRMTMAQKKWQKESQAKLSEAEKLAKMSEEDKYKHELSKKEAELETRMQEIATRENKIAALKALADKGLPADLADLIVSPDADETMDRIKIFHRIIQKAVAEEVTKRLASPTPKAGLSPKNDMSRADFQALSMTQKLDIKRTNPELYNKLK